MHPIVYNPIHVSFPVSLIISLVSCFYTTIIEVMTRNNNSLIHLYVSVLYSPILNLLLQNLIFLVLSLV